MDSAYEAVIAISALMVISGGGIICIVRYCRTPTRWEVTPNPTLNKA